MSVTIWNTETAGGNRAATVKSKAIARRVGFGVGLVMATGTAYAVMAVAVLLASSIVQF